MFLLGHFFCCFGLAIGTQIVLSCLNCWCIVVTLLCSPLIFSEVVSLFRVLAVGLLIFGSFWVSWYGPQRYRILTVERLSSYMENEAFLAVSGICFVAAVILGLDTWLSRRRSKWSSFPCVLGAAMCA